jgi:hypothetical protein
MGPRALGAPLADGVAVFATADTDGDGDGVAVPGAADADAAMAATRPAATSIGINDRIQPGRWRIPVNGTTPFRSARCTKVRHGRKD